MNIDFELVENLKKVVLDAYEEAKNKKLNIKHKELNDIVTDVDVFMEEKIIEKIKQWFPEHSIYSEEAGEIQKNSEYEWMVDPIDGTINFAAGIPLFSTSIALNKNNETIF